MTLRGTRAAHAVVSLAALDVRRRPDHRAELTSQLLLGEVVRVLETGAGRHWRRVENLADGYRGWVRDWGLVPASGRHARSWLAKATARVTVPVLEARLDGARGALMSPLFLNSRVIPLRRRGTGTIVELPDRRRAWVRSAGLARPGRAPGLMARIRSLLGSPYHWGGRTPLGYDCSAFTQQVLGEQGVLLPRDCSHQFKACRALEASERPEQGDLVFFAAPGEPAGHVGIAVGGGFYAHCRGSVRMSSLELSNRLCDKELVVQFVGWRRSPAPLRGPAGRGAGGGETS